MDKKTIIIAGSVVTLVVGVFTYGFFSSKNDEAKAEVKIREHYQKAKYLIYVSQKTHSNKGWFKEVQHLPEIGAEDRLVVDGTFPFEDLREGMMVIFRSKDQGLAEIIIHPVLKRKDDGWVTKGYANASVDRFVMTKDNYMGVAVEVLYENGERKELKY